LTFWEYIGSAYKGTHFIKHIGIYLKI